jgi:hypothetical protein
LKIMQNTWSDLWNRGGYRFTFLTLYLYELCYFLLPKIVHLMCCNSLFCLFMTLNAKPIHGNGDGELTPVNFCILTLNKTCFMQSSWLGNHKISLT